MTRHGCQVLLLIGFSLANHAIAASLGENCTSTDDCRGSHAYCSLNSSVCECQGTFISSDGLCKAALGSSCELTLCHDRYAMCTEKYICKCKYGYVQDNGICKAIRGFNCEGTQCYDRLMSCVSESGTCDCKEGYRFQWQQCYPAIGGSCSQSYTCGSEYSSCSYYPSYICECWNGYVEKNGYCHALLGSECSRTDCFQTNALCRFYKRLWSSVCVCPDGFIQSGNYCLPGVGAECKTVGQCADVNSYCDSDLKCKCESGYTELNSVCAKDSDTCKPEDCYHPALTCSNINCTCAPGYVQGNNTCKPDFGQPCGSDTCFDIYASCSNTMGTCQCTPSYIYDFQTRTCKPDIEADCSIRNCFSDNSFCNSDNICECITGYTHELGSQQCVPGPGKSCSSIGWCGSGAICISGVCQCPVGYGEINGYCYPGIGANCSERDCFQENLFCNSDKICECMPGYTQVAWYHQCLPGLGTNCSSIEQCGSGAYCISGVCQCPVGYGEINGYCYPGAGMTCADSNFQCYGDHTTCSKRLFYYYYYYYYKYNNEHYSYYYYYTYSSYSYYCKCNDGYRQIGYTCTADLGANCSHVPCSSETMRCSNNSICICKEGFTDFDRTCRTESQISCSSDECMDDSSNCSIESNCSCPTGYKLVENKCRPELYSYCVNTTVCADKYAECTGHYPYLQCLCKPGYTEHNRTCTLGLYGLGFHCYKDEDCYLQYWEHNNTHSNLAFDQSASCIDNICSCKPGYVGMGNNGYYIYYRQCLPDVGSNCTIVSSCYKYPSILCSPSGICECANDPNPSTDLCEKGVGTLCGNVTDFDNGRCYDPNASCMNISYIYNGLEHSITNNVNSTIFANVCICNDEFKQSGAICKADLGYSCKGAVCYDINAVCMNDVCVCKTGYIANNGVCRDEHLPLPSTTPTTSKSTTNEKTTLLTPSPKPGLRFDFGTNKGDQQFTGEDDACSISIQTPPIPIFRKTYTNLFACSNGIISFVNPYTSSDPPKVHADVPTRSFLAPYFTDLDLSKSGGTIFYQVYDVTRNSTLATNINVLKAQNFILDVEGDKTFSAKVLILITWLEVPPYPGGIRSNERVTFQAALVTDGINTFAIYLYFDKEMTFLRNRVFIGYSFVTGEFQKHLASFTSAAMRPDTEVRSRGYNGVLHYRLASPTDGLSNEEFQCLEWFERNAGNISYYEEMDDVMPTCPCSLRWIWFQNWFTFPNWFASSHMNTFCTLIRPASWYSPHGKTCCYDRRSWTWVSTPPRAGGFLLYHPSTHPKQHETEDVRMRDICCDKTSLCHLYYELRPVGRCFNDFPFVPGWFWGDPHIETLDKRKYTFNGFGEYTMIKLDTGNQSFVLQARTDLATDTNGSFTNATIFSAFAAKDSMNASIHVELDSERDGLSVFGNRADYSLEFTSIQSGIILETEVLTLYKYSDPPTLMALFTLSGISMNISLREGMLALGLSMPKTFAGMTKGLLGNFNEDPNDDFMYPNGTHLVGIVSERDLFNYGQNWMVLSNESVLRYPAGKSSADFLHKDFVPTFMDETDPTEKANAEKTCAELSGKDDNPECVYDLLNTGNENVAKLSRDVEKTLETIVNETDNTIPSLHGNATIYAELGLEYRLLLEADDDGQVEFKMLENTANATLEVVGATAEIRFILVDAKPVKIRVTVEDDKGFQASPLDALIIVCTGCSDNGICDYETIRTDPNSTDQYKYATCQCQPYWEGTNCELDYDACATSPCSLGRTCSDVTAQEHETLGLGYKCSGCPIGYETDGSKCRDIDECDTETDNCKEICLNTDGSFQCLCPAGFKLDSDYKSCSDINECEEVTHTCSHVCVNTIGAYNCSCFPGYELETSTNNCRQGTANAGCDQLDCSRATGCFVNSTGNPVCFCKMGKKLGPDGKTCQDINECEESRCGQVCHNTDGSFLCSCNNGFSLNDDKLSCSACTGMTYGTNCSKTCECDIGAIMCNHVTGCVCNAGWTGSTCEQDIDECTANTDVCMGSNSECRNSMGSYVCECQKGFAKNSSGHCVDINECEYQDMNSCEQRCNNVQGSYICSCRTGYTQSIENPYSCTDIDECFLGISACQQGCENLPGRFNCLCYPGYVLEQDRRTCKKLEDLCAGTGLKCDHVCVLDSNDTRCTCNQGYKLLDDTTCTDINECTESSSSNTCNPLDGCVNNNGSFECRCAIGYKLQNDGRTCLACDAYHYGVDCMNECRCSPDHTCDSVTGCTCPTGWEGENCNVDVDECKQSLNPCNGTNIECINNPGHYQCVCKMGYIMNNDTGLCQACTGNTYGMGCSEKCVCSTENVQLSSQACHHVNGSCLCKPQWSGSTCEEDVNECQNTNACDHIPNSDCFNMAGGYRCQCKTGFTDKNGKCENDLDKKSDGTRLRFDRKFSLSFLIIFIILF